jgi:hypothetical protein
MKVHVGVEVWLPTYVTLALDGDGRSVPYSSQITTEKLQYFISEAGLLKTLLITDSEYT